MSDYFCTGSPRPCPENDGCGGPPPGPFPRPDEGCAPPSRPAPRPDDGCSAPSRGEKCPCRAGLVQALQMLLRSGLSSIVDFQSFAFVTDSLLVGGSIGPVTPAAGAYDNLDATVTGSFNRFTPCACDHIDVTGTVYLPFPGAADSATGLTAGRLDLCDITAVSFGVEPDTGTPEVPNYTRARNLLQRLLQGPCRPDCPPYPDPCADNCCCDCDPDDFLGGSVSLVAGPLLIANATALGNVGKVLALANDTDERFYFVCRNKATFVQ